MTLELSRIKALCFDVDGTLSDTDDLWSSRMASFLDPVRFLFPKKDPRAFARWALMAAESPGNLAYWLLDWAKLDDDLARLFNWLARRKSVRPPKSYWIIPQVQEMLRILQPLYPMAVVSARDQTSTLAFLDQFELRAHFRCVATSQTCAYTKPFPHPIRWAAEQMGVQPHEVLMIGDTPVDIRAGVAAGAQTVGVLCGFGREAELSRAGANHILSSTAMLPEILFPSSF
jgi:N-acetyl-D-muramate 6-phosphate phosphatase